GSAEELSEEEKEKKRKELQKEMEKVQSEIGSVKNDIERLDGLRDEEEEVKAKLQALESLYDEAEELEETYRSLRAELRRKNIKRLDELLNEIFSMIYSDDSYARIELSDDYELTVYEKDDTPLDPKQLSGGERAIFNLSLRCAIYRLLVEGVGAGDALPPLILDEPTTFLDSEHVSHLIDLTRAMNHEFDVEQIIVVSHNEELLDAADHRIMVEKDSTTNRSRVEKMSAITA
ncbi:MAG: AAA family ATPase, partial [Halobacteria archaeon]|nr:AAA family ATPase [Halobacteria archaeon]